MQSVVERPLSDPLPTHGLGDQAEGLRRLFSSQPVVLTVAACETELIAAYARIKRLVHERNCHHFQVSISRARSEREAHKVFDNLQRVAREYLGVRLEYLGMAEKTEKSPAATTCARHGRAGRQGPML